MCRKIQDGGKVCQANQGRNCGALLEKVTLENTKMQLMYGVVYERFLLVSLQKEETFQVITNL